MTEELGERSKRIGLVNEVDFEIHTNVVSRHAQLFILAKIVEVLCQDF